MGVRGVCGVGVSVGGVEGVGQDVGGEQVAVDDLLEAIAKKNRMG